MTGKRPPKSDTPGNIFLWIELGRRDGEPSNEDTSRGIRRNDIGFIICGRNFPEDGTKKMIRMISDSQEGVGFHSSGDGE